MVTVFEEACHRKHPPIRDPTPSNSKRRQPRDLAAIGRVGGTSGRLLVSEVSMRTAKTNNLPETRTASHMRPTGPLFLNGQANMIKVDTRCRESEYPRANLSDCGGIAQAVIESAADGIIAIDSHGEIRSFNPAAERLFGYSSQEAIGQSVRILTSLFAGKSNRFIQRFLTRCMREHIDKSNDDVVGCHKNGRQFPIEVSVSEVMSVDESIYMGIVRDASERKRAITQLKKLSRAVEHSPASVVITDRHGKIEYVNPNFTRLTGYSLEDAVGKTPRILKSGNMPQEAIKQLWDTILAGREWRGELQNRKKNGELYWEYASISPIIENGEITHFVGVKENITERKRTEAELSRLHDELIEASREAGMAEIATGVLHNVGNALNSVNVSACLMLEKLEGNLEEKLCEAAAVLQQQGDKLGEFISRDPRGKHFSTYFENTANTLLNEKQKLVAEARVLLKSVDHISDIVAMQQKYASRGGVSQDFRPSEVMNDALQIANSGLTQHGIHVEQKYQADCVVAGDRHKLIQILVNLISNAKHAVNDSLGSEKKITLHTARLNDKRIAFVVEDNGVGIAPETQNRLFEHGFTTKKDGHGFGLHSAANAAREMGGELVAHSDGMGDGATFTLYLPVNESRCSHITTAAPLTTGSSA